MLSSPIAVVLLMAAAASAAPEAGEHAKVMVSSLPSSASQTHSPEKKTLLQIGAKHRSKSNPMLNPEYFGLFAQGESTYSYEGTLAGRKINPEIDVLDGWNPHEYNPLKPQAASPVFFHESPSGAYMSAWQSHYPALGASDANLAPNPFKAFFPSLTASLEGDGQETGPWFTGSGGYWQQQYENAQMPVAGANVASWFDSSVRQVDGFGRQKFPGYGSPENYVFWEQRSVNTTLSCEKAGCNASVSLAAPFDVETEEAAECLISVFFHPTVLSEKHGEFVEWVYVNDQPVQSGCRPVAAGCNKSAQLPLQPCVYNVPLGKLMHKDSSVLTVSAKIVDSKSQCPYKGNHLSAVPMVTCLVGKKTDEPRDVNMMQRSQGSSASNKANMLQRILEKEASRSPRERKDNRKPGAGLRSLLKKSGVTA